MIRYVLYRKYFKRKGNICFQVYSYYRNILSKQYYHQYHYTKVTLAVLNTISIFNQLADPVKRK